MTANGSRSSRARSVCDAGIGAVAVGDDVAPWRLDGRGGPPLLAGREARAAAAAQARTPRPWRSSPVGPRSRMARRRPSKRAGRDGRVEVGRDRGVGALQQDRRPAGRRLRPVDHGQAARRGAAGPPPARRGASVEGGEVGRLGRAVVLSTAAACSASSAGSKRRWRSTSRCRRSSRTTRRSSG